MTAAQELPENQHEDQYHIDELTGVKTPLKEFLSSEFARIKGIAEPTVADVEAKIAKVKAEAETEVEQVKAEAERLVEDAKEKAEEATAPLKSEIESLKAELEALKAKPTAKKTPAKKATAVRETGDVKTVE